MFRNVWGHRGCRGAGNPPENSLAAFQAALEYGVGGIELDVHLSADGAVVVLHDSTLERMTGFAGAVSSLPLAVLKKLRLLTVEGHSSKQTIPTLEEVLDLVTAARRLQTDPVVVNIELKDPHAVKPVAALVARRLAAGWKPENFLISSFDMNSLREIKPLLPTVPIGTLFECSADELARNLQDTADLHPATVNLPFSSLTPAAWELLQAAGVRTVVWTPNETNPSHLPHAQREELLKALREREFVIITDYPKELLHLVKPNKAKATATGVLAACLSFGQQNMLFRPNESGLENLKSPSDYPDLKRFGFRELPLTAEDCVPYMIWERRGESNRPHFLLFHGNRAHWGDTGAGDRLRDRRARLKFIEELASSGSGVTAVTLRGFGRSAAIPSEEGFLRDLRAVTAYLSSQGFDHRKLVVAGESLGTWAATQTAVFLTRRDTPPAVLCLQNPFTCLADVGEQVVSHLPLVRSLHIAISASSLDRHVLKNHFYTANLFQELSARTLIYLATSGRDGLVHPSNSDKLAEIARKRSLPLKRDFFPEAFHHSIPPVDFARRLVALGVESCLASSAEGEPWVAPLRPIELVDSIHCL